MRNLTFSGASAIAVAAAFVAGCANNNVPTKTEYSGFLGDYSNLQQTQDADQAYNPECADDVR